MRCSISRERDGESGEDRKVGVERDPFKPANAERCQPVLMLQSPEPALDGSTEEEGTLRRACRARLRAARGGARRRRPHPALSSKLLLVVPVTVPAERDTWGVRYSAMPSMSSGGREFVAGDDREVVLASA